MIIWKGRGILRVDGKDLKHGGEIPEGKLDENRLNEWIKTGLVVRGGEIPPETMKEETKDDGNSQTPHGSDDSPQRAEVQGGDSEKLMPTEVPAKKRAGRPKKGQR